MPAKKKTVPVQDVSAWMSALSHPHQDAIELLRQQIRSADPRVREEVKWNAPSYAIGEQHFATFHLRAKQGIALILHHGAKKQVKLPARDSIPDPAGLLDWVADDRAVVSWAERAQVEARRTRFVALIKAWIAGLSSG